MQQSLKSFQRNVIIFLMTAVAMSCAQSSTLSVAYRYPVWNLNPFKVQDKESRDVCELIYAGLIGIDNALNNIPEMAACDPRTWDPVVNDPSKPVELVVPLREDVKWHNGLSFISEDVVATFDYLRRNPVLPGASKIANIHQIRSEGPHAVRIIFKKGQFTYRNLDFKIVCRTMVGSPEKERRLGDSLFTVVGTGPYRLNSWDRINNIMGLAWANNGYRGGGCLVKNIAIVVKADEQTRYQDLQSGNIDLITDLPAKYSSQLQDDSTLRVKVLDYPSVELCAILFNFRPKKGDRPNPHFNLFRNRHFRRALDLVIDKKKIYDDVFLEGGSRPAPLITGPFLPASGAYNASVVALKWEEGDYSTLSPNARIDEAKKVINNLKTVTGVREVTLDMVYLRPSEGATEDLNNRALLLIEYFLGELGVKLNVIPLNKSRYFERLSAGDYDLALYEWSSGLNPSVAMWEPRQENEKGEPLNPANISGYDYGGPFKREFQRSVETVKFGRRDAHAIIQAYHFIHQQLHDETAAVFLWNRNLHIAINSAYQYSVIRDPVNFLKSVKDWGCPQQTVTDNAAVAGNSRKPGASR